MKVFQPSLDRFCLKLLDYKRKERQKLVLGDRQNVCHACAVGNNRIFFGEHTSSFHIFSGSVNVVDIFQ